MKTIVITGVSSGIGAAFIKSAGVLTGYRVVGLSRSKANATIPKNVEIIQVDITSPDQLGEAVKGIVKKYKTIDVLINNAGSGSRGSIEDTSRKEVEEQFQVNLWPTIELTKMVIPLMRKQRGGHIISVSSLAATVDYPTIGYYGATKAFIEKLMTTLAIELKPWDIRVSLVIPGAVKSRFGASMSQIEKYDNKIYSPLYSQWKRKFRLLFRNPSSSEEAAERIISTITSPRPTVFLRARDHRVHMMRSLLGPSLFNKYLLNRHMK